MRRIQKKLDEFCQLNLRKIMGVTWKDKVTNTDVLKRTGQRWLQDIVGERRFRFAGHVLRMTPERTAHSAIDWIPVDGRKRKGRLGKTWRSTFVTIYMREESDRARRRN